jgi:hypothetical protein
MLCQRIEPATPGSEVIKKFSKLKLGYWVFDWLDSGTKCPPTNENPEI